MIISTMLKLLFAMLVGYFLRKIGIINHHANRNFSSLIIYVTSPALILHAINNSSPSNGSSAYYFIFIGSMIYICLIPISYYISKLLKVKKHRQGTASAILIFSNSSFMAIPVCQAFYGDYSIFYVSLLLLPFNILLFTYGFFLLEKDRLLMTDPNKKPSFKNIDLKKLLNPGLISSLLAVILYAGQIKIPAIIDNSLSFVSGITMPLSMIAIGASLAEYKIKEIFSIKSLYPLMIIRLLLLPLLIRAIFLFVPLNADLIPIITMIFAMPVASMVVMISTEIEADIEYSSAAVAISTICSMVSIPLIATII